MVKPASFHNFVLHYKHSWPNKKGYYMYYIDNILPMISPADEDILDARGRANKYYLSSDNYLKLGNLKMESLVIAQ